MSAIANQSLTEIKIDGFEIISATDNQSAEKAITIARATGSKSATYQDGARFAEVRRLNP
jgi:hypothetical protein